MKNAARLVSVVALLTTILPCALLFAGQITDSSMKTLTLAGTVAWFLATPTWMGRDQGHAKS